MSAEVKELEAKIERLHERLDFLHDLTRLPRLNGGVLSIAYDVRPEVPRGSGGLMTYVVRHEFRGKMRQAEAKTVKEAFYLMEEMPFSDRVIAPDDVLEALKVPMSNEVKS